VFRGRSLQAEAIALDNSRYALTQAAAATAICCRQEMAQLFYLGEARRLGQVLLKKLPENAPLESRVQLSDSVTQKRRPCLELLAELYRLLVEVVVLGG
jgi:hypothetical protein